jgi:hypothetical protein
MKRLTTYILVNAVILLLLSCGTVDLSKKYPNMVADMDPFSVGTFEAQFDRFLSAKVKKNEIEAVFHPRFNYVSIEFKHDLLTYRQFWDEPARKQFAAALELYKRDFEDGKLVNNNKRTKSVYGNAKGRVEWLMSKYTKTRTSNPIIEIGYQFKENTPFFSTFMRPAKEVIIEDDSSQATNSQQLNMYFTRAQADVLAEIFNQAHLVELVGNKNKPVTNESTEAENSVPKDTYREFGER